MKSLFFFAFLLLLFACTPSRFVKPLAKNEMQVNLSLGGPVINLSGSYIPVPLTTICGGYGIDSNTTVFGSIHTTSALFGNLQNDIGVVRNIAHQKGCRLGISAIAAINTMAHFGKGGNSFNLFPQFEANIYWTYGKKKNFVYAGLSNWFNFSGTRAHNESQPFSVIMSPQLGHTFNGSKWNFILEYKMIAPYISNKDIVISYLPALGAMGATGIYFGVTRKF